MDNLRNNPDFLDFLRKNYSNRTVWNTLSEAAKLIEKFLESKKLISNNGVDKGGNFISDFNGKTRAHYMHFKKEMERAHTEKFYHGLFDDVFKRSHYHYELIAKGHYLKQLSVVDRMIKNFYSAKILIDILLLLKEGNIRKHIWNLNQDPGFERIFSQIDFRGAIEIIKEETPEIYPIVKMYYLLYNLSIDPVNLAALRDVHSQLVQNSESFSDRFKSEVYFTMFNCYMMMKNDGKDGLDHEIFSLINEKLNEGIIFDLQNVQNEQNHFRDHVIIALRLGEVDWASDFVERYSDLFPERIRVNMVSMCKALIEFKRSEFDKALGSIKKIRRIDYLQIVDYYSMYIKCQFELGNFDECSLAVRRFSVSLKHVKQIPDNYMQGSENFIRVMSKLLKHSAENSSQDSLLDIALLIKNSTMLIERNWLLRKISLTNSSR